MTVYSYDGKININTASSTVLKALYRDFTEDDMKRLIEERDKIGGWLTESSFVDFVSNNLGRSGFKTYFNDPANYPFTVSSQSFLIESSGILRRSKSVIMKTLRIGVALTAGKGGSVDDAYPNAGACNKVPGRVWNPLLKNGAGACIVAPTTAAECTNLAGSMTPQANGQQCCVVPNVFGCPPAGFAAGAAPAGATGGAAGGTPAKAPEPNALKILFWSEG